MQYFDLSAKSQILYHENFFTKEEADNLYQDILATCDLEKTKIKLFGKEVLEPRLVAFHSDENIFYTYSHSLREGKPWTRPLNRLKENLDNFPANSALVNFYEDGSQHMGWHCDNEPELGNGPIIYSFSFGGERKMSFRHKKDKGPSVLDLELGHGSLLIMKGATQEEFHHCLRKTSKPVPPRLNITFRKIYVG